MPTKTNKEREAERLITEACNAAGKLCLTISTLKRAASGSWYWGQKSTMDEVEKLAVEASRLVQRIHFVENN